MISKHEGIPPLLSPGVWGCQSRGHDRFMETG